MTVERRDDLGMKMAYAVAMIILTLFIHASWSTANTGKDLAQENQIKIAKLESFVISIKEDIAEIKNLLKRRLPEGG